MPVFSIVNLTCATGMETLGRAIQEVELTLFTVTLMAGLVCKIFPVKEEAILPLIGVILRLEAGEPASTVNLSLIHI